MPEGSMPIEEEKAEIFSSKKKKEISPSELMDLIDRRLKKMGFVISPQSIRDRWQPGSNLSYGRYDGTGLVNIATIYVDSVDGLPRQDSLIKIEEISSIENPYTTHVAIDFAQHSQSGPVRKISALLDRLVHKIANGL